MSRYPGVALPIASHWVEGDQLVGYFTEQPGNSVDRLHLKRYLGGRLPGYMVPDVLVRLEGLPRLPNGKVDRRNLPPPTSLLNSDQYVPPATTTEKALALIWARVLNLPVDKIGRDDNFLIWAGIR